MKRSSKSDPKFLRKYDRIMLRASFVSLFWGAIEERRKRGGFTFKEFAKQVGTSKSEMSRWFRGQPQNWTLNTVASLADALDLDIRLQAVERSTGIIYTPDHEPVRPSATHIVPKPMEPIGRTSPLPQIPTPKSNDPDTKIKSDPLQLVS